ncbi:Hypothetical predicted protein [Olea europaea subsp. europaea]|uniref:Uncharacterized protein n=1 Tax=Olea europaea subsp. europaea TaxID=158383 RepID=A0A8S0V5G8_OLEEU|nr:Hypothetical predicted protein [Olea europaea subsp. europaea]
MVYNLRLAQAQEHRVSAHAVIERMDDDTEERRIVVKINLSCPPKNQPRQQKIPNWTFD